MLPGDVLVMKTRGCGGWGDPLTREPDRVKQDVSLGYLSADRGRQIYGVAIDRFGKVNTAATSALRKSLRAERVYAKTQAADKDAFDK